MVVFIHLRRHKANAQSAWVSVETSAAVLLHYRSRQHQAVAASAVITYLHGLSGCGLFCTIYLSLDDAKYGLNCLWWTLVHHMPRI